MDEVAKNIYNKTLHLSKDQKQYLEYIRADQAERDREGQLRYAKEKGLEKGLERGKEEKEVEIAINLKNKGISLEIIAETTGMSISKIKKL